MNRRQRITSYFILSYVIALILVIVFKFEHYPFTWAHMFSRVATSQTSYTMATIDPMELQQGIEVFYKDGSEGRVTYRDLNIPLKLDLLTDSFSGIYRLIVNLCDDKYEDESAFPTAHQASRNLRPRIILKRMMFHMNQTLGRSPDDPKYIVSLAVRRGMIRYSELDTHVKSEIIEPTSLVSCNRLLLRKKFQ